MCYFIIPSPLLPVTPDKCRIPLSRIVSCLLQYQIPSGSCLSILFHHYKFSASFKLSGQLLLIYFPIHPRQTQPQPQNDAQQCQNNRLQHFHATRLRDCADHEREDGRTASTKRCCKSNSRDVQMTRKKLCRNNDGGGETRA